jgi:hypothetical protein
MCRPIAQAWTANSSTHLRHLGSTIGADEHVDECLLLGVHDASVVQFRGGVPQNRRAHGMEASHARSHRSGARRTRRYHREKGRAARLPGAGPTEQ